MELALSLATQASSSAASFQVTPNVDPRWRSTSLADVIHEAIHVVIHHVAIARYQGAAPSSAEPPRARAHTFRSTRRAPTSRTDAATCGARARPTLRNPQRTRTTRAAASGASEAPGEGDGSRRASFPSSPIFVVGADSARVEECGGGNTYPEADRVSTHTRGEHPTNRAVAGGHVSSPRGNGLKIRSRGTVERIAAPRRVTGERPSPTF